MNNMKLQTMLNEILNGGDLSNKSISQLADIVYQDWKNINSRDAKYWLKSMSMIQTINDMHDEEAGYNIIQGFLSYSGPWHGTIAKDVKLELNRRIKGKFKNYKKPSISHR